MTPKAITEHALNRYQERTGTKDPIRSLNKIHEYLLNAVRLSKNRWYNSRGKIIIVAVKGVVRTAYRPRPRDYPVIFKAMNRKKKVAAKSVNP